MLIRLTAVYAGAAKNLAGGTPVFAGTVSLVIGRLLSDFWEYKTLFKADCLCITVCFNMYVRFSFPPEEYALIGSTEVIVIVKV